MKTALVSFLLFASAVVAAKPAPKAQAKAVTLGEAPMVTARGHARRLFVVGFAGQVNITPSTKGDQIVVRALKYMDKLDAGTSTDALNQLVVRSVNLGDTVEVRAQLPPNGSDWTRWASGKHAPEARLDISAPENMSLEIYWTHGEVHVPRWKAPVVITSQEGHLSVSDVTGDVTIRSMFGSVKVDNIKGAVKIENFSSTVAASEVTGKVKIRNFSGETHVKGVTGPVAVSSQKGPVTIQDTQGNMTLQSGLAAIKVLEHKGTLIGHSDAGAINVKLAGTPIDARLSSSSGPLTLSLPRDSQAAVSLYTNDGHLTAPPGLESKKESTGKYVRGRLGGGETGRVHISSDSGDVSLRVYGG